MSKLVPVVVGRPLCSMFHAVTDRFDSCAEVEGDIYYATESRLWRNVEQPIRYAILYRITQVLDD